MPKIILFVGVGRYCITTPENYDKRISDANGILKFPVNCTKQDAIDYILNSGMCSKEDIVDRTGE